MFLLLFFLLISSNRAEAGEWGEWENSGRCSETCGGGVQYLRRTCTTSSCSGDSYMSVLCNVKPCPIDGQWSQWKLSKGPSESCGYVRLDRDCNYPKPANGGKTCLGEDILLVPTNDLQCHVPTLAKQTGQWSKWETHSSCSVSCGGGVEILKRKCLNETCAGDAEVKAICNLQNCPIDGNWGPWKISECSSSCGDGEKRLKRSCDKPKPSDGGKQCEGEKSFVIPCNLRHCPIDGVWGEWSPTSECSVTCGGQGFLNHQRVCNVPAPAHGGKDCVGNSTRTVKCQIPCSVDGNWGMWTSSCSATSSKFRPQERVCNNPSPDHGGKRCVGHNTREIPCNTPPCQMGCSKIAVGLGTSSGYESTALQDFEVIDLSSVNSTCQKLKDFPIKARKAAGGLGLGNIPIICEMTFLSSLCYSLINGEWISSLELARWDFAMSRSPFTNDESNFFVTGGLEVYSSNTALQSTEVLIGGRWQMSTPMPEKVSKHCMLLLNSTSVMAIGGEHLYVTSHKSFIFNSKTNLWSDGPMLKTARKIHSCAMIRKDSYSQDKSVFVVGGMGEDYKYLSSTELLDVGSSMWKRGPELPYTIGGAAMVEDPSGGVVIVGGENKENKKRATILRRADASFDTPWEELPQQLDTARSFNVAFFIPDQLTNCK